MEANAPHGRTPAFDIVALGASAGGLHAFETVLAPIPGDLPVPLVLVQHLDPRHRSLMAEILGRHTHLTVKQVEQGEHLAPGVVYVAAPDNHLLITTDGTVSLTQSELVRFSRPSIDLLFDSVAGAYRERAVAVVMTGTGSDGAHGVEAIKEMGGTVIVQDEDSSEFDSMPHAAIATGCADFVLPLEEIGPAIVRLVLQKGTP